MLRTIPHSTNIYFVLMGQGLSIWETAVGQGQKSCTHMHTHTHTHRHAHTYTHTGTHTQSQKLMEFTFKKTSLFIWLRHKGPSIFMAACGIFRCGMWEDPVPRSGIELSPELGEWSLRHWTNREVPEFTFYSQYPINVLIL